MAELLSRLLSRQRRRNPFADVMGPDPLESAATMDAAQGADVSTPAPVARRSAPADTGSNILMASTGGGSGPFRTAGGSGASRAPVQETGGPIRNFFLGGPPQMQARSSGQRMDCSTGQCRMVDDGGFPVTTTVVGSAPMASGGIEASAAPSPAVGDIQGGMDAARFWDRAGDPSSRQLEKDGILFGFTDRQLATNDKIVDANIASDKAAREYAIREQEMAASKTAAEVAALDQDRALAAQQTQLTREATGIGQFDTRREIIARMITEGGSPTDAAHALARLASPANAAVDKDGKPIPPTANAIPQTALEEGKKQAFGAFAVHLLITSQQTRETADLIAAGNPADSIAPRAGETQDEYARRAYETLANRRGLTAARAADAIIGGLQQSQQWRDGDWNGVNMALEDYVGGPLNQYVRKTFLDARRDDIAALPPEQRQAAEIETINRAEQYANYTYSYFQTEALAAFLRSKGGQYEPNMTYMQNVGRAAEYFGGDKKPDTPAPVDSNDTLPPYNPTPVSRNR